MKIHYFEHKPFQKRSGEVKVKNFLFEYYENLEESGEVWMDIQPHLGDSYRPDIIIVDPRSGAWVIEIKDWSGDYVKDVKPFQVITKNGEERDNPYSQLRNYLKFLETILWKYFRDPETGESIFPIQGILTFHNEREKGQLGQALTQIQKKHYPYMTSIWKDSFSKASSLFHKTIDSHFSKNLDFDLETIRTARAALFPELKVKEKTEEQPFLVKNGKLVHERLREYISTMDEKQEKIARVFPKGHRLLTGIPGSGKTAILLNRAVYILKEHPGAKIAILTYTNALVKKVQLWLEEFLIRERKGIIQIEDMEIKTFHSWLQDIIKGMGEGYASFVRGKHESNYFDIGLPQYFQTLADQIPQHQKYDAILVDEYQDFTKYWFPCLLSMLRDPEESHLLLAGDHMQRIYQMDWKNWKELGIKVHGRRSHYLDKCYRTRSSHILLALAFLKNHPSTKKDVEKYYENIEINREYPGEIYGINGDYQRVSLAIQDCLNSGFHPENLLILAKTKDEGKKFLNQNPTLGKIFKVGKIPISHKGLVTTYHSAKGLESPIVFLLDVDTLHTTKWSTEASRASEEELRRRLFYVGLTRASERIYLQATDFTQGFAGEIVEIAEQNEDVSLEFMR